MIYAKERLGMGIEIPRGVLEVNMLFLIEMYVKTRELFSIDALVWEENRGSGAVKRGFPRSSTQSTVF